MSDTTLNAAGSGSIADTRLHDIVVGVDGSDESFAALRWALNEASLTGQQVNAVFAWSHSWDMGSEPEDEEQWAEVRHDIAQKLRDWVSEASQGMTINEDHVKLTSVKATGTSALLEIGRDAQQIVVGRRSLGRVARWFLGSLSASLAEAAGGSGHRGAHSRQRGIQRAGCHRQCAYALGEHRDIRPAGFPAAKKPASDCGWRRRIGNIATRPAVRHRSGCAASRSPAGDVLLAAERSRCHRRV